MAKYGGYGLLGMYPGIVVDYTVYFKTCCNLKVRCLSHI
jgi:hypothetical protein